MNWLNKLRRQPQEKSDRPTAPAVPAITDVRRPDDSAVATSDAVMQQSDKTAALSRLADLTGEDNLVEVALRARFAEVRLAAAQRLVSEAALERVVQASRGKDKGVYRHCSNTLRERQAASDGAARAAVLERELEALQDSDPVSAGRLVELEREFRQLGAIEHKRCAELIDLLRSRVQEQARHQQLLHARLLAAQALAADLARQPVPAQAEWQRINDRWCELAHANDTWPAWLSGHKELTALQALLGEIESGLAAAGEDIQRLDRCAAFLEAREQEAVLGEEAMLVWESLEKPASPQLRAEMQSRWEVCLRRVATPTQAPPALPSTPAVRPPRDNSLLQQLIAQLEAAIEQGHLAEAGKLVAEIESAEATAGLPHALAQRLAGARAQLLKLRGWARWGNDQVRQQLIVKAEQLLQEQTDIERLAAAIAALRQEWKTLDVHGAASRALWEQFDAAAERAYAPVAAHRAEQAAKREAARLAKEALCLEWENWLAQIQWEHADIKVIQTMRQEICDTWRSASAGREQAGLRKRFEAILARLDPHIDAARHQEIGRCEALITAAEALQGEANLRRAIETVKLLQQRWRDEAVSVRLARSEQGRLWKRFRSACDAIFARRDEEKSQQTAQLAQRSQEAQHRLEELQAALSSDDIGQVQQCLADFRAAWRDAKTGTMPAPVRDVLQQAEDRLQSLQARKRQAPYQVMAQKMAIAERIERAAAQGAPVEELLREAQATWQALPHLPEKFEQPLARRLAAAPEATAAGLAAGLKLREGLLLDLEIALELRSPDVHDESRRMRHLQLLQQRFRRDQPAPADLGKLIVHWHATAAVADPQQQLRMTAILRTLENADAGAENSLK